MSVAKYRKKPVVIEAIQYEGTSSSATPVINWILENGGNATYRCKTENCINTGQVSDDNNHNLVIRTLEGEMVAAPGDFIIKGVQGEFYPCKPDIFAQTYDKE